MGFINVLPEKACNMIEEIWDDFITAEAFDSSEALVTFSESPKNGTRLLVKEGQTVILLSDGKIADCIDKPGGYIYHRAVESLSESILTPFMQEHGELFTDKEDGDIKLCLMNSDATVDVDFKLEDIFYYDSEYDIDITLHGSGSFLLKPVNPVSYYLNCIKGDDGYDKETLRKDFVEKFPAAAGKASRSGVPYNRLPYVTDMMLSALKNSLGEKWKEGYGLELCGITFTGITPDNESFEKIIKAKKKLAEEEELKRKEEEAEKEVEAARRSIMEADPELLAEAVRSAMASSQSAAPQENSVNASADNTQDEDGWHCPKCGNLRFDKFCLSCGTTRPVKQKVLCSSCGTDLTDRGQVKFCPNCGARTASIFDTVPKKNRRLPSDPLEAYIVKNLRDNKPEAVRYYMKNMNTDLPKAKSVIDKLFSEY